MANGSGGLVTLTIDDRQVSVPLGTGLVEAAVSAGVEIPVFCYEPRLGPPVGACRMCLVEIEGNPKLQAGCTLTASEGMVVRTAATSPKAADGQEATLEFILVNHPLDCPVCDKGGECPLQDLTFRYGPGATRMTFPKATFDKPIPISPLIALDRERCILCYRCTRFSEEVAEDGLLIARNRGARTEIATFEDEPYDSVFSGNVIELCPVGALTSSLYRFDARPWEIQNVPTVCTGCAVGCNVSATIREGRVKRILSRNHPEIDGGWLCDKGRFAYPHLRAHDRILTPLRRGPKGLYEVSWDEALDMAEEMLRSAEGAIVTALSGSETNEIAYALGRLLRLGLGAHSAVLPEATSDALGAFRLPLSAIADAELVVVVGDDPVVERAPIVDLWIKQARRGGAEVVVCSPTEPTRVVPGGAAAFCRELGSVRSKLGKKLRGSDRAVLVWSGPGGGGGARIAELAHALGFDGKPGCGAFQLPGTPNGLGVAASWSVAADADEASPEPIALLVVSGDEAAADPSVRALAEEAERVLVLTMFQELAGGWADLILPATAALERDGTSLNLEGRLQRLRSTVPAPCPEELVWLSELAARFGVAVPPQASLVFDELSERLFSDISLDDVGLFASLPPRHPYETPEPATTPEPIPLPSAADEHFVGELRLQRYRPLLSGPAVERIPELEFQRPERVVEIARGDAERRGIAPGDEVLVRSNGTSVALRAQVSRKLHEGVARIADEHAGELHATVEVVRGPSLREAPNGGEA
jgi:NADH-quinone oxidoreductase subunit G